MKVRSDVQAERLAHVLDHLGHLLPAQGPIGVFIHHNTLHAFQHQPFHEAVTAAAQLFDAEPYLTEAAYREAYRAGRIRDEDLDAAVAPALIGLPGTLGFVAWTSRRGRRVKPGRA